MDSFSIMEEDRRTTENQELETAERAAMAALQTLNAVEKLQCPPNRAKKTIETPQQERDTARQELLAAQQENLALQDEIKRLQKALKGET